MNIKRVAIAGLLAAALPLPALATDCAHVRDIDLALDLDGIETIAFEVNSHDLQVRVGPGPGFALEGRACASSEAGLGETRVIQERKGSTLEVRLERGDGIVWNLFRDHLILEYEIPKWDGDLGPSNFFMPLSRQVMNEKTDLLLRNFASQRSKDWFDPETFTGLARLRGMECRARDGYAEAFMLRKATMLARPEA